MPRRRSLAGIAVIAVALSVAAPAPATPVCTGPIPKAICLGRTVPEPMTTSVTLLTYNEFRDALTDLAAEFPGKVVTGSMGLSRGGHQIPIVEVTNPASPIPYADRKVVYVAQSIHGNEPGGREGMIRVIEDLARATDAPTLSLLNRLRVVQFVPNPDGWVRGDWDRPGSTTYTRGNSGNVDLNRQFPWKGWIPASRTPLSEAEARAVVDDVRARIADGQEIVASADLHGMGQNQAAVWTMLSSGEFDVAGMLRQRTHGEEVEEAVKAALGPRPLFVLGQAAGGAVVPHVLTTSSEFQGGLSGSGFLGDWIAQKDGGNSASLSTIEFFHNQPSASGQYNKEIIQIHVDATRAIVRTLMEEAVAEREVEVDLAGTVAYLHDRAVVAGATPMRFFEDLQPFVDEPLRRVELADFHDEEDDPLAGVATLVATSDLALGDSAAASRIASFVRDGGNLVLTDAGLKLLPAVDPAVPASAVASVNTVIGNASFVNLSHKMAAGVRSNAIHLYEPATLGYDSESATQSPVWRVTRSAFDAGGTTIATTSSQTSVGVRAVGAGTVRVIGGLLPPPTTRNKVLYGLNDYAPTDTGWFLFLNAIGGKLLVNGEAPAFDAATATVEPNPTLED